MNPLLKPLHICESHVKPAIGFVYEELKIAREEEKKRMLLEEERRKQAAKQMLLELEAKCFVDRRNPANPWKRDTLEVGSNSSFLPNDQENGLHSPRREASIVGRSLPRKDILYGDAYTSSRNRAIESEFYDNGVEKTEKLVGDKGILVTMLVLLTQISCMMNMMVMGKKMKCMKDQMRTST
ncbi:hypothetical protein Tco_1364505 [Tanacetum coccineum]